MIKTCINCGKEFTVPNYRKNAKYCNYDCYWAYKKKQGQPTHLEDKCFQKGNKVNVGRKRPDTTYRNMHDNAMWKKHNKKQISPGTIEHNGYIFVYTPKHPFANGYGYVREHRLEMEKKIGRFLKKEEVVHHIDGDKFNNVIENLKLFKNHSEHIKFHAKQNPNWGEKN